MATTQELCRLFSSYPHVKYYFIQLLVVVAMVTLLAVTMVINQNYVASSDIYHLPHDSSEVSTHEKQSNNDVMISSENERADDVTDNDVIQRKINHQRERVCEQLNMGYYTTTHHTHLLLNEVTGVIDHYARIVYCDVGKISTTSWYAVFKRLSVQQQAERMEWMKWNTISKGRQNDRWRDLQRYGFSHILYGGDTKLQMTTTDYFKFMFVRHPLERLASAYFSKVINRDTYSAKVRDRIREYFKKNDLGKLENMTTISFTEFLKYVVQPDTHDFHWSTFQSLCQPCLIHYDYIGRLETLGSDLGHILPRLKAEHLTENFPEKNVGPENVTKYMKMYQNIPLTVLQPVLDKYQVDADMFNYSYVGYHDSLR